MSFQDLKRVFAVALLLLGGWTVVMTTPRAWAQEEGGRKVKSKVVPAYPELARHMKIAGVVKVQITVAPNGTVKDARVLGGHPVLAGAVLDAVKKWRYEVSPQETTESREFRFAPEQ